MAACRTHLTALRDGAAKFSSLPLIWAPYKNNESDAAFAGWESFSHSQFYNDTEKTARFWYQELSKLGLKPGCVIGIWLKGNTYRDALQIWGISRAGYIPQLISLRMTSPDVVYELLKKTDAGALIVDPAFDSIRANSSVPTFLPADVRDATFDGEVLGELQPKFASDTLMILHTSGSTSGTPKLVPMTAGWLDHYLKKSKVMAGKLDESGKQSVQILTGSFCHFGALGVLILTSTYGGSVVIPTAVPFPPQEVLLMSEKCGLNILGVFSSLLASVLRETRTNEKLLTTLQGFELVGYGGLPLPDEDWRWSREKRINIVNFFASTEVGNVMKSIGGFGEDSAYFQPFDGTGYEFIPIAEPEGQEGQQSSEKLMELVISPDSFDCPHPSLRDPNDGKFHTGDLFVEAEPGKYLSRGRMDDWIKMAISLRCNTLSIEQNALEMCGKDLISAAVVVGSARPSPVLFVEPKSKVNFDAEEELQVLKNAILSRILPFHERRYTHERIEDTRCIVIVPPGTLPRNTLKGTIRRRAVEEEFKAKLDLIFAES